jgi:hypothetical protein
LKYDFPVIGHLLLQKEFVTNGPTDSILDVAQLAQPHDLFQRCPRLGGEADGEADCVTPLIWFQTRS